MSPLASISPVTRPLAASALTSAGAAASSARPSPADLQKASRQFEAILVRQMIGPAIEPMMSGGSLGGSEGSGSGGGVYAYMLTDVLSNSITTGGGLGLSAVISRQLSPSSADAAE